MSPPSLKASDGVTAAAAAANGQAITNEAHVNGMQLYLQKQDISEFIMPSNNAAVIYQHNEALPEHKTPE